MLSEEERIQVTSCAKDGPFVAKHIAQMTLRLDAELADLRNMVNAKYWDNVRADNSNLNSLLSAERGKLIAARERIAELEARHETLCGLLMAAQVAECSINCQSQWKSGEQPEHSLLCGTITMALGSDPAQEPKP